MKFLLLLCCWFLASTIARSQPSDPFRLLLSLTNQVSQIQVHTRPNQLIRIDGSRDLRNWETEWLLTASNAVVLLSRTNSPAEVMRFWRALEVGGTALTISSMDPASGSRGSTVTILGTGFDPSLIRNQVTVGGAVATLTEASSNRIRVTVPSGATSGEVKLMTPAGSTIAPSLFTVIESATVQFSPPAGLSSANYRLVGLSAPMPTPAPDGTGLPVQVNVRVDLPSVVSAVPISTNALLPSWMAWVPSGATSIVVSAKSTAEAMVALHPFFLNRDPYIAGRVAEAVRTNTAVATLASVLESFAASGQALYDHPEVLAAYERAVIAVGTNSAIRRLSQEIRARRQAARLNPSRPLGVYFLESAETRFIEVERENERFSFQGFPFNPVDWWVLVEEIDVDRAFPRGRTDFNALHQQSYVLPTYFPPKGKPPQFALVGADLLFSRFGILGYAAKLLSSSIGDAVLDKGLVLPGTNAIYAAYAFGPSFDPNIDRQFANDRFSSERNAVLVLNLVAAILDLQSAIIDLEVLEKAGKRQEFMVKLVTEAGKSAGTIRTGQDFLQAALDLTGFVLKELVTEGLEAGAEAAAKESLKAAGKTLTGVLKVLDIIGGFGQVAERASGLIRTTPLEEMLLVLGDPFQLRIESIEPAGAAPGDLIEVVISGAEFDRFNRRDAVQLETGTEDILLPVLKDPKDGLRQRIQVRIPDETANLAQGVYTITVIANGRRGSAPFELVSGPTVRGLLPATGFAVNPTTFTFPQSHVSLIGFGFTPEDRFTFAGEIDATEKFGVTGSVTLTVPQGARTGPIRIRTRRGADGASPPFTILGPPELVSMEPASGPIGTRVTLKVRNVSENPNQMIFEWLGISRNPFSQILPGANTLTILFSIPDSSRTGPLTIRTPAGAATREFTVLPGRARGGSIAVGGESPIGLAQALAYASGTASPPPDDGDFHIDPVTGTRINLDPPFEHADFIGGTIGADSADSISIDGQAQGSFVMNSSYDTLKGEIRGSLTITGSNNVVDITVRDGSQDGLVVQGSNNRIRVWSEFHARHGIRIDGGSQNRIELFSVSHNKGDGIVLTGGAEANVIFPAPLIFHAGNPQGWIRSNAGHGIVLRGAARGNLLGSTLYANFNAGDGVRFEGEGVIGNQFLASTTGSNGGNGITITGGASQTRLNGASFGNELAGVEVSGAGTRDSLIEMFTSINRLDGIAILGNAGLGPAMTTLSSTTFSRQNGRHGVFIQNVHDPLGRVLCETIESNNAAGIRLEGGAQGWEILSRRVLRNATGIELAGATTQSNRLTAEIYGAAGIGARLEGSSFNLLNLTLEQNRSNGLVLASAHSNYVTVKATGNAGAGVLLQDASVGNVISNSVFTANTNGLVVSSGSSSNIFSGLRADRNAAHAVWIEGAGTRFNQLSGSSFGDSGSDVIRVDGGASDTLIGSTRSALATNGITISARRIRSGIRIAGSGTSNTVVQSVSIVTVASDTLNEAGIIVEDGAIATRIGSTEFEQLGENYIARCRDGILIRSNAVSTRVLNTYCWAIRNSGVNVNAASDVQIGDMSDWGWNLFAQCTTGVTLQNAPGALLQVIGNEFLTNTVGLLITNVANGALVSVGYNRFRAQHQDGIRLLASQGIRIQGNELLQNASDGIEISSGASDNDVIQNSILLNSVGVRVSGATTLRNTIQGEGITSNTFQGIVLNLGGNRQLAAPVITDIAHNAVFGRTDAPDGSRIELFRDSADEGETFLSAARVLSGKFRVPASLDLNEAGILYQLNATVTDPDGNTSPFGGIEGVTAPKAARIVFVTEIDGQLELMLLQDQLAAPTRLTTHPATDIQPALHPRGTNVLFVSNRNGKRALLLMPPLAGADAKAIAPGNSSFDEYEPSWSPDGRRIAFVSEADGNPEVYLANSDGGGRVRISSSPGAEHWPVFGPSGTNLIFLTDNAGTWRLVIAATNGLDRVELPADSLQLGRPSWSPDGTQIAFVQSIAGGTRIATTTPTGAGLASLVESQGQNIDPIWGLTGKYLLFASDRTGKLELHSWHGSNAAIRRLTVTTGPSHSPSLGQR